MSEPRRILVPLENPNDEFATLLRWHCCLGERVEKGAVLAELENAKATFELAAEEAGHVYFCAQEGTRLRVGDLLAVLSPTVIEDARQFWAEAAAPTLPAAPSGPVHITAKARKRMKELGLAENNFAGLAEVRLADVEAVAARRLQT